MSGWCAKTFRNHPFSGGNYFEDVSVPMCLQCVEVIVLGDKGSQGEPSAGSDRGP